MSAANETSTALGVAPPLTVDESLLARRQAIGRAVERLIESRRMSFGDLARATGLSKTGAYNIVDGKSDPTLSSLLRIADFFGVTLSDLLPPQPHPVAPHTPGFSGVPLMEATITRPVSGNLADRATTGVSAAERALVRETIKACAVAEFGRPDDHDWSLPSVAEIVRRARGVGTPNAEAPR